ncbi:MAG: hypothetical protein HYY85_03615 [Deltaproteobacteria bacterium]|nr:hypothetical protein [Deltaproteobacteria bacterium]
MLIVEDDSDGRAIAELAAKRLPNAQLSWLPANGIGNIKRNAEKLILLARDRLEKGRGCVAVLVDRDRKDPSRDEPHRTIARACRRAKVEFIAAREALEAWFLADRGICQWLGLTPSGSTDRISDPKGRVEQAFYRKTGRPYMKRRARLEVARQSTGVDTGKNGSAQQALGAIQQCLGSR